MTLPTDHIGNQLPSVQPQPIQDIAPVIQPEGHIPVNAPQAPDEEEISTTVQRQLPGQWLMQLDAMIQHAAQSAGGLFSQNELIQAIGKNGSVKPDADELEVYLCKNKYTDVQKNFSDKEKRTALVDTYKTAQRNLSALDDISGEDLLAAAEKTILSAKAEALGFTLLNAPEDDDPKITETDQKVKKSH